MTSHTLVYLCLMAAVLCAVSLYICLFLPSKTRFVKVVVVFIAAFLMHLVQILICELFFPDRPWLDRWTPFGIIYGPFIYFGLVAVKREIGKKEVLLHSIPFLAGWVIYVSILVMMSLQVDYLKVLALARVIGYMRLLSLMAYMIWAVIYFRNEERKDLYQQQMRIFLYVLLPSIFYIIIGILFVLIKEQLDEFLIRFMVYTIMLSISIGIFLFSHQNLVELYDGGKDDSYTSDIESTGSDDDPNSGVVIRSSYSKSALTENLLEQYEEMIYRAIEKERLYLDPDFSLELLSRNLKIPRHHLSQTFNLRINSSFTSFINRYRIKYACDLMRERKDLHLLRIGEMSGFNSKTSFNRNFKIFMDCTPNEYRVSLGGE